MLIILFYTFKKIFKENSKTISFLLTLIENGIKKKNMASLFSFFIKKNPLEGKPNPLLFFCFFKKNPCGSFSLSQGLFEIQEQSKPFIFPYCAFSGSGSSTHMASISIQPVKCAVSATDSSSFGAECHLPE